MLGKTRALTLIFLLALSTGAWAQLTPEPELGVSTSLPEALETGKQGTLRISLQIPEGYHLYAPEEDEFIPTTIELELPAGIELVETVFPPGEKHTMGETEYLGYEGVVAVEARLDVGNAAPAMGTIKGVVSFQMCDDAVCFPPDEKPFEVSFEVTGGSGEAAGGETGAETDETESVPDAETEDSAQESEEAAATEDPEDDDPLWLLLVALGAGFLTCLTPCVYPMIPITVAYFANLAEDSHFKTIQLALLYAVGMSVTYAALGVLAGLLGFGFSDIMTNPYVIGTVVVALLLLAGGMFGAYELRLPSSLTNWLDSKARGMGGGPGTFMLGATLGLVAAPCVGPFVGALLIPIIQSGSPAYGGLAMFVFGLGMGIPFVVLAVSSNAINQIPGAGMWMVKVKQFFGFVLIVMALYFLANLMSTTWVLILTGVTCIFWGVFTGGLDKLDSGSGAGHRIGKALGLIILMSGIFFFSWGGLDYLGVMQEVATVQELLAKRPAAGGPTVGGNPDHHPVARQWAAHGEGLSTKVEWEKSDFSLEEPEELARQSGRPVFVDFWASWCAPCTEMDRTVFRDEEVIGLLNSKFVPVKADTTEPEMLGTKVRREKHPGKGVPYFAFYDRQGNLLEELSGAEKLSKEELLERLEATLAAGEASE